MFRRTWLARVATLSTAVALTAGCLGGPTGKRTSSVEWKSFAFEPANIHIEPGTTVTWTNNEQYNHTVTAASENWSKDTTVPPGEQTTHTFTTSGLYVATCTEHGTKMKIAVGDATIKKPIED